MVGAASGLGLLVVSFLPWYSAGGVDATAWQAFSVVDLVIAAAALLAISIGVVALTGISRSYPVPACSICLGLGTITFLCVLCRLIDPPGSEADPQVWAWVGLIAAAGVAFGAWLGLQEPKAVASPAGPAAS